MQDYRPDRHCRLVPPADRLGSIRPAGTPQCDCLYGVNARGVSFAVGISTAYSHGVQHQVANLRGTTTGQAPINVDAVVDGPDNADDFSDAHSGFPDGVKDCALARYAAFEEVAAGT